MDRIVGILSQIGYYSVLYGSGWGQSHEHASRGMRRQDVIAPVPVKRALHKLGRDLSEARRRRRITTETMAERASISRVTLRKVEKGDPGVSMGIYARVLFVLGMAERLGELADVRSDTVGLELEEERLPKRVRPTRRREQGPKGAG